MRYFNLFILFSSLYLGLNAQNRLVPGDRLSYSSEYQDLCDRLLLGDTRHNLFAFMVYPSFSMESGCHYDYNNKVFVLREPDISLYSYSLLNSSDPTLNMFSEKDIKVTEYRCRVSQETAGHFERLFFTAVISSSFLSETFGVDGTIYKVSFLNWHCAYCQSPAPNSNCGNLVRILSNLSDAIKSQDSRSIDNMIAEVDNLARAFEALLPEEEKKNSDWSFRFR